MKKILLIIVLLVLMFGGMATEDVLAATKYSFSVINHTNDKIIMTIVEYDEDDPIADPEEYIFKIDRFDSGVKELPKGTYKYEYVYCGGIKSGTLKLNSDKEKVIYPCGVENTKMRFNSHFGQDITVTMYGPLEMPEPEEEDFVVELGGNRIPDILSGHYIISYQADCSTVATDPPTVFSEEIRVLKSGTTQITLHGCEWYAHPARTYDKPVPVKFRIVNHASFPLILQIVGPEGALLEINPGVNLFELIYGTYKYGYFLDGSYHTGYMMVTKNGLGQLVLKPSHIFELPTTGGDEEG
jgi:hypothetical protein